MTLEREIQELKSQSTDCVYKLIDRWKYFITALVFKEEVRLSERMELFATPAREFVEGNYPQLLSNPASEKDMFWTMIFAAVYGSKTYPASEINAAVTELRVKMKI